MNDNSMLYLVLLGFASGFINMFAGGGSMLVVPFLIFLGLPPHVANATNRVAILLQNIVSTATFRQKKILNFKTDYPLLLPTTLGSILGAFTAVDIQAAVLQKMIGGLLVVMFFMILLDPNTWVKSNIEKAKARQPWVRFLIFGDRLLWRFYTNRCRFFYAGWFGIGMWLRFAQGKCFKSIAYLDLYFRGTRYFYLV